MKQFKSYLMEMELNEVRQAVDFMTERGIPFTENVYRPGSEKYYGFFKEVKKLVNEGVIEVDDINKDILETDIGEFAEYEGKMVPLDIPLISGINEEKDVELNKPKRGGPKKFYVYVKDPKTKNVKKVTFGDTTGLKAKINDPEARKSFAARHNCSSKKDKTKAGYWSCRLPRYAKALGMQVDNPGAFW
jgi:hypothetical protein